MHNNKTAQNNNAAHSHPIRIGLLLPGGGARCAHQWAVLTALDQAGIFETGELVGVSSVSGGTSNGLIFANGKMKDQSPEDILKTGNQFWHDIHDKGHGPLAAIGMASPPGEGDIFPNLPEHVFQRLVKSPQQLYDINQAVPLIPKASDLLKSHIDTTLRHRWDKIKNGPIQTFITASVKTEDGYEPYIFTGEELSSRAVAASCAVSVAYRHTKLNRVFYDGAYAHEATPDPMLDLGVTDLIVIANTKAPTFVTEDPVNRPTLLAETFQINTDPYFGYLVWFARTHDVRLHVIDMDEGDDWNHTSFANTDAIPFYFEKGQDKAGALRATLLDNIGQRDSFAPLTGAQIHPSMSFPLASGLA